MFLFLIVEGLFGFAAETDHPLTVELPGVTFARLGDALAPSIALPGYSPRPVEVAHRLVQPSRLAGLLGPGQAVVQQRAQQGLLRRSRKKLGCHH